MVKVPTVVKAYYDAEITPLGIEYLQNNSTMQKTWERIKDAGGILFSAISAFSSLA